MSTRFQTLPSAAISSTIYPRVAMPDRIAEWLVITDNDPELLSRLEPVVARRHAIVIKSPQTHWDFDQPEFVRSIDSAFERGDIKNILLAGRASTQSDPTADLRRTADDAPRAGFANVVAGACRTASLNRKAEEELSAQAESLSRAPRIHQGLASGDLELHLLLYRAEIGGFVRYQS